MFILEKEYSYPVLRNEQCQFEPEYLHPEKPMELTGVHPDLTTSWPAVRKDTLALLLFRGVSPHPLKGLGLWETLVLGVSLPPSFDKG